MIRMCCNDKQTLVGMPQAEYAMTFKRCETVLSALYSIIIDSILSPESHDCTYVIMPYIRSKGYRNIQKKEFLAYKT